MEIHQVAVGRASGQLGAEPGQVADAHGMSDLEERLDDCPPPGGVSLVDALQPALDDAMEIRVFDAGHDVSGYVN